MLNATPRPEMTVGRAALIELLSRYLRNSLEATPLEIQKLMYFLQVVGEPLRLEFSKGRYGPYADGLRRVLSLVEGHFLTGYGDGSSRVLEATSIRPLPAAGVEASRVLDCHPATRQRIAVVDNLTDGFESMYGMELLSTVHWLAVHDRCAALDWRRNAELVREWTPRKAEIFTDDHVHEAWLRLRAYDLIEGNALNRPSLRMSERMPSGGKVVTVRVSRAELGARLIQAIRESAFPISDVAVITATRGESDYIQQLLDAEEIPTRSLEEFDGTWLDAVKVGTVRRAKGLEFAAVFHPTPKAWAGRSAVQRGALRRRTHSATGAGCDDQSSRLSLDSCGGGVVAPGFHADSTVIGSPPAVSGMFNVGERYVTSVPTWRYSGSAGLNGVGAQGVRWS